MKRLLILTLFIGTLSYGQKKKIYSPLKKYSILQAYANRPTSFGSRYHCADDLHGAGGTEVYAIADGDIVFSGEMDGYGWLIVIDHPSLGVYSLYGHLSTRRDKRLVGAVKANDRIAFLADDDEDGSGPPDSRGGYPYWRPHLHFGVRKGKMKDYLERTANRWMAGYTPNHPTEYGWLNPRKFLKEKKNLLNNKK